MSAQGVKFVRSVIVLDKVESSGMEMGENLVSEKALHDRY